MRKLLALSVAFVFVAGCDLLGKKADPDASTDAAPALEAAAPVVEAAAPVVVAKNAGDIARFGTETAVNAPAKTASAGVVYATPKGGGVVATLKAGTDVEKVATYQGSNLVTFLDPKDGTTTLMGWLADAAFGAVVYVAPKTDAAVPVVVVDAGKPASCSLSEVSVLIGGAAVCKKRCLTDKDCKGAPAGSCANASAVTGGIIKICAN